MHKVYCKYDVHFHHIVIMVFKVTPKKQRSNKTPFHTIERSFHIEIYLAITRLLIDPRPYINPHVPIIIRVFLHETSRLLMDPRPYINSHVPIIIRVFLHETFLL
jgi:hypothetical protein